MLQSVRRSVITLFVSCIFLGAWFFYTEIYTSVARPDASVRFAVETGDTAASLAQALKGRQIVRSPWMFRVYLRLTGDDRHITAGEYIVEAPITTARVAEALSHPGSGEMSITILPGWDVVDVSNYIQQKEIGTAAEWSRLVGAPAQVGVDSPDVIAQAPQILRDAHPSTLSWEGYLAPDTYRIYKGGGLASMIGRMLVLRGEQLQKVQPDITASGHSLHEILTMASILEREVQSDKDKAMVADIFWRRIASRIPLQADSTVHYVAGKNGSVFTSSADRQVDSPWNTYKYLGLPPTPICNPGMSSIIAALHPAANDYWFFLTTPTGEVKYAKTLEEHNKNRAKFL